MRYQLAVLNNHKSGPLFAIYITIADTVFPTKKRELTIDEIYSHSESAANQLPFKVRFNSTENEPQNSFRFLPISGKTLYDAFKNCRVRILEYLNQHAKGHSVVRLTAIAIGWASFPDLMRQTTIIETIRQEMKTCGLDYFDLDLNSDNIQMSPLDRIRVLPNSKRYLTIEENIFLNQSEFERSISRGLMGILIESDQKPLFNKRTIHKLILCSPIITAEMLYRKKSGNFKRLSIDKIQKKASFSRGTTHFRYTEDIVLPVILGDFNNKELVPTKIQFEYGSDLGLSIQHNLEELHDPDVINIIKKVTPVIKEFDDLFSKTPPIYLAKIPCLGSYGVFAEKNLKGRIGILSGEYSIGDVGTFTHSFLNILPGYTYSPDQSCETLFTGNFVSFINSTYQTPFLNATHANVELIPFIYKRSVFLKLSTLNNQEIPAGEQLLFDAKKLVQPIESNKRFTFFSKNNSIIPEPHLYTCFEQEYIKGQDFSKNEEWIHAKKHLSVAYYLIKICVEHPNLFEQTHQLLSTHLAMTCEALADVYCELNKKPRAMGLYLMALDIGKLLEPQTNTIEKFIVSLSNKINKIAWRNTSGMNYPALTF